MTWSSPLRQPRRQSLCRALAAAGLLIATAGPALADIPIATAGPMTGSLAAFGEQFRHGAALAVRDINARGGVLGEKLTLSIEDDVCDPKQAVAVANRLVGKGVVFVAGHACSGSSIAASKVYEEEGLLMISPASTAPELTEDGGDLVFRVCGRDDQQAEVAADYIHRTMPRARVAVLHDKSAYGKGLATETRRKLAALGQTIALDEAYTAGEKDYRAVVSKLKQADIDLVFIGGYHTEIGLMLRQAKTAGLEATFMAGDGLMSPDFWGVSGGEAEGTLMTFSADPRKNAAARAVVERFDAEGIEPAGYTLYAYAAVQVWAQAAEKAASVEPEAVAAALRRHDFASVLGEIVFDRKGDVSVPGYVVYRWSEGSYDYASKLEN
ncbi:MAG TPA: branched-chain amino acid ABC transporter substrate-binding protein [Kiloniellaceae bacterium]|nr:branched-chain amino acid ABC transporter substrate-binding protein [Kiloniellaceae bacterium]